jgi:HEPN domain-containing protein
VVAKTGEDAEVLNLDFTLAAIHRFRDTLLDVRRELMTMHEISDGLDDINSRLLDEMNKRTFFYVPQDRAAYFDKPDRYGSVVASKCPQVTEDVSEAGNCFSAGRYTATVFHLMRIMEHGVQRFGTVIGAPITDTKNWQAILNEVNARIKGMDPHDQKTKFYAEISAHLYHVKLAWRNEVMHPKATYTEEEAKNLIKQVGEFMETLAIVL